MPAPLCRYCGGPIKKSSRTVYLRARALQPHEQSASSHARYLQIDKLPSSIDECRTLTNWTVLSVKRNDAGDAITYFHEWDGECYADQFFCNGSHARDFAYLMAANGRSTTAYANARAAQAEKEKT